MDSPETPSRIQGENFPKKDNDQSTLHTPKNFTPLPTTSDRKPHEETKETEDNGGNTKPSEDTADSSPTQKREEQEADARESQPPNSQQTIPQQTGEQGKSAQPEKDLNQALTQANLLLIEAIKAAVEGSYLENEKKGQFLEQLKSLQQKIITNPDGIPLEQLGEEIANIGKNLNSPQLQILGLELQERSLEDEEKKQRIQNEINKIAGENETLKNQIPRLYKLFTGEELPEEAPFYKIYDIAVAFAQALNDKNNREEILQRAKELDFNPESLRQAFDSISQHATLLQQAVEQATTKEKKDPLWKKAAGLGLLGIILFLFVLIRSGLAGERE